MTCTCGSPAGTCSGGASTPAANPAGLTQIAYRVNDFAGFREALLTPLPGEEQLTGWSPGPEDLGLQVLEWWAYLADVLTFYNERIANEDYLRTAVAQPGPRHNVKRLARLLGYLARPGITATGVVAAIRSAGSADGRLVIPAGLQITSTPAPGVPAQLFETRLSETGEVPLFKGTSDGPIVLPLPDHDLLKSPEGQESVLLAGQVTVPHGAQLVLVEQNWDGVDENWVVVTTGSTITAPDPNGPPNTRVPVNSPHLDALKDTGPTAEGYQLLRATATVPLWTLPTIPRGSAGGGSSRGGSGGGGSSSQLEFIVPLATLVRSVAPGDIVLFTGSLGDASAPNIEVLAYVIGYHEVVTRARPSPAGNTANQVVLIPHSRLRVRAVGARAARLENAVDNAQLDGIVMLYGFREAGILIPTPAKELTSFAKPVTGPPGILLPTSPVAVALQDAKGTGLPAKASTSDGMVQLHPAEGNSDQLSTKLEAPIRLFANIVRVSRGTTVRAEILGNGDPAKASQSFVLQHSPLVYVPAPKTGEPETTLTVSVDGVTWREVQAFAGQPPTATVYVVRELVSGHTEVVFGDGIDGARLPLGVSNVTATYQYAPAAAQPPPTGHLTTVLQPQPNLASVTNPVTITPGTEPEPARQTAAAAPSKVVLLGAAAGPAGPSPLISPGDCERLAATVGGVARVRAYWAWEQARERPAVALYVGGNGTTEPDIATVREALFSGGAPRIPLKVTSARAIQLRISCQLLCTQGTTEAAMKKAVKHALTDAQTGLFSPAQMAIGQRLYHSQVEAALAIAGVITVLGLRIERSEPGGQPGSAAADRDEPLLDPGQDGYFSLRAKALEVGVVTQ